MKYLDLKDNDVKINFLDAKNSDIVFIASLGSAYSIWIKNLAHEYSKTGVKIRILDTSNEYKKLTTLLDGNNTSSLTINSLNNNFVNFRKTKFSTNDVIKFFNLLINEAKNELNNNPNTKIKKLAILPEFVDYIADDNFAEEYNSFKNEYRKYYGTILLATNFSTILTDTTEKIRTNALEIIKCSSSLVFSLPAIKYFIRDENKEFYINTLASEIITKKLSDYEQMSYYDFFVLGDQEVKALKMDISDYNFLVYTSNPDHNFEIEQLMKTKKINMKEAIKLMSSDKNNKINLKGKNWITHSAN